MASGDVIIAALILLGIADCVTTYIGLKRGDTEANPVAAKLFGVVGPVAGMLLLKLLCTAAIIFVLTERPSWWPLGAAFVAGYVVALVHNVRVLRS